jgi:hypothetical protein
MIDGLQYDITPTGGEYGMTFPFSLPLSLFLSLSTMGVEKDDGRGG